MSEEEDRDLLALQRQLDDAFQTTRPRPAFEDELWRRMQARRPLWTRLRGGVAGLLGGWREAPALPSAAVAIALIVLIGAGIVSRGGFPLHGGGGASSSLATQQNPATPGGAYGTPAYGALPVPASLNGQAPYAPNTNDSQSGKAAFYTAPVVLMWAGQLSIGSSSLPVFRYQEPTAADADRFAVSVGASPSVHAAPGGLGMYTGKGFTLVVTGTVAQPAREASYELSQLKSTGSSTADPVALATAYLAAHGLTPTWPYTTVVQQNAGTVRVLFLRSFDLQAQGQAPLVDGSGNGYGADVDIAPNGLGAYETGPLPLHLDSADYPIIDAQQAVRSALASSAPSNGTTSYPVVNLTSAELVYTLVWAGDHSFYEPAFLFSGTFTYQGTEYVKRVLVPAVAPPLLSP